MAKRAVRLGDVIAALGEAVDEFVAEAGRAADMSDEQLARTMVTAAELLVLFDLVVAVVEGATFSGPAGGHRG